MSGARRLLVLSLLVLSLVVVWLVVPCALALAQWPRWWVWIAPE